jgi:enoyl-CoA hydratase
VKESVSFESAGDVAILRLDDGKANALSPDVLAALGSAIDHAEESGQAILLTGRPDRFSAGFDLNVMRAGDTQAMVELVRSGARVALQLSRFPGPVVIGCTGHALAMGAVLLLTADTRIGAAGDFKLGFNEVGIGMTTPDFLLGFARERLSKRHFLRATVQAEIYDPVSAIDAGFLDRVATGDVFEEALAEATRLAKLPRTAYAESRKSARRAALADIEAGL